MLLVGELISFIMTEQFLSPLQEDFNDFMADTATIITALITPGTALPSAQLPAVQVAAEVQAQKEQWFKYAILAAILFFLFAAALQRIIVGEVMFYGLVIVALVIGLPPLIAEIMKHLPAHLEEKKPPTFEALVQEKLGDYRVTKKRIGMMRLYRGAFRLCAILDKGQLNLPEVMLTGQGSPVEGVRGYFKTKFRAEFPARLSEVVTMVNPALHERRTLLDQAMTLAAAGTPHMPPQQQVTSSATT